jgi:hypothetical protein
MVGEGPVGRAGSRSKWHGDECVDRTQSVLGTRIKIQPPRVGVSWPRPRGGAGSPRGPAASSKQLDLAIDPAERERESVVSELSCAAMALAGARYARSRRLGTATSLELSYGTRAPPNK